VLILYLKTILPSRSIDRRTYLHYKRLLACFETSSDRPRKSNPCCLIVSSRWFWCI